MILVYEFAVSTLLIIACLVFARYFMNEAGQKLFGWLPGIISGIVVSIRHWK